MAIDQDDILGGRGVMYRSADTQIAPQGDKRQRVNPSRKFYVAQMIGAVLNVSEYAERVTSSRGGERYVVFEKVRYQLRKPEDLRKLMGQCVGRGMSVYVGGISVDGSNFHDIELHPFIYIVTKAAAKQYDVHMKGKGHLPGPVQPRR